MFWLLLPQIEKNNKIEFNGGLSFGDDGVAIFEDVLSPHSKNCIDPSWSISNEENQLVAFNGCKRAKENSFSYAAERKIIRIFTIIRFT